jgi:putative transferase (TIGR04331 family)
LKEQDKEIWQEMNSKIANPLGGDTESRYLLHNTAREVEEVLFPRFVEVLNNFHETNHTDRFWKMLCGHWFRESVDLLINRVKTIESCFLNHRITGLTIHEFQFPVLPTMTYADALSKSNDNVWNSELFKKIIEKLELEIPEIDVCNCEYKVDAFDNNLRTDSGMKKTVKESIYGQVRFLLNKLSGNRDAFIINSYLPLKKEFLLQLAFGQIPQWRLPVKFQCSVSADLLLRRKLSLEVKRPHHSSLENIICELLFEIIPI